MFTNLNTSKTCKVKRLVPTCMFPIRNENSTKPEIEMKTAKQISQTQVLVERFWPRELHNKEARIKYQTIILQVNCNVL